MSGVLEVGGEGGGEGWVCVGGAWGLRGKLSRDDMRGGEVVKYMLMV